MEISAVVTGDRDIAARLEQMPARLQARLAERITSLTARLLGLVRAAEPKRTGRLESETRMRVDVTADLVRGRVFIAGATGNDYAKAGALEYGAHRRVAVRAFERHGHTPEGAPADQMVAAYSRQANIIAHRFERGALEAMKPQIEAELKEAVEAV